MLLLVDQKSITGHPVYMYIEINNKSYIMQSLVVKWRDKFHIWQEIWFGTQRHYPIKMVSIHSKSKVIQVCTDFSGRIVVFFQQQLIHRLHITAKDLNAMLVYSHSCLANFWATKSSQGWMGKGEVLEGWKFSAKNTISTENSLYTNLENSSMIVKKKHHFHGKYPI